LLAVMSPAESFVDLHSVHNGGTEYRLANPKTFVALMPDADSEFHRKDTCGRKGSGC